MKRKIVAFFCTAAILCACLCGTAFAAKKPSIELMSLDATWNGAMVTNPVICFRVNGNKTIKYARWYVTAYNRVDDKNINVADKNPDDGRTIGAVLCGTK